VARSIFFYIDSGTLGGAEEAMLALSEALDRSRWRPTLLLADAEGADPIATRAAAIEMPVRRVAPMPLGLTGAARAPGLARLLRAERPDVFHALLPWPLAAKWGLAAALLARVPATVATAQLIPPHQYSRSNVLQLRLLSRGVGRYIAVSRQIAAELTARFGWPAEKIEVLYNAVEADRFEAPPPQGLRQQLGGGERPIILTTARLDEQKGHTVLLRAATEVPDAVFALAGEGPLRSALERETAALGIADRVLFLGRRDDVPQLLGACDLFALPSLYEGSPISVLEAMAAGRAVVSSAIAGTDELIEDGASGILVPPGDPAALAAALRRLLSDRELREGLARRARERVRHDFDRDAMVRRVERIYEDLLGARA
jgi:glycosyltransferase involved in cell wall biosynthesis